VVEARPETRTVSRREGVLRIVGLDIVGPLLIYRLCRGAGVSEVWALVLAGSTPLLGVLIDWIRWRTLEVVGTVVLAGIALSIALALVTDDPKVVLLEGAASTAALGLVMLGSLTRRRPLIFYFAQAFYGGRHSADGAELDADYDLYEEARFFWRTVTIVWAVAYFLQAAAQTVVVLKGTTATALTFNRTVPWVVFGLLMAWSFWWGNRLRAQKSADEPEPESNPEPELGSSPRPEPER
jgi:hypothetical protein